MDRMAHSKNRTQLLPLIWKTSLACFIIAALTGFLYRLGLIGFDLLGLSLQNIRHAHSHLMFFGWAVPFPMYIALRAIIGNDPNKKIGHSWMKYSAGGGLVFGLLAYPFFLFYGYRPVEIGTSSLPLSVIFSGLVMVCWYGFIWGYYRARPALKDVSSQPWFDGALVMLAVCSLGAWGVALAQAINPENHLLMKALTHFFLATFTEGWVVIVLVAILVMKLRLQSRDWPLSPNIALGCIAIGAPLTFPYGISESLLSPELLMIARFGGGLASVGLLMIMFAFYSSGKWKSQNNIWLWPIVLLGLKAVIQLTASIVPSSFWLSDHALRIFYLHVLLLGAFTLTVIGWLHTQTGISDWYFKAIAISILAVLISLLLPTPFWPEGWGGIWIFYVLAATAILPVLAVLGHWIKISTSQYIQS